MTSWARRAKDSKTTRSLGGAAHLEPNVVIHDERPGRAVELGLGVRGQPMSYRSNIMTLFHAWTKSLTNFSCPSELA